MDCKKNETKINFVIAELVTTFTCTQHTQYHIKKRREIILIFSVTVVILNFVPHFLLVNMSKKNG